MQKLDLHEITVQRCCCCCRLGYDADADRDVYFYLAGLPLKMHDQRVASTCLQRGQCPIRGLRAPQVLKLERFMGCCRYWACIKHHRSGVATSSEYHSGASTIINAVFGLKYLD